MKLHRVLTVPALLVCSLSAQAKPVAEAHFDLETGKLCFPMLQTATGKHYDVCLQQKKQTPQYEFSLLSITPATHDLGSIPTYDPQVGLALPLARLSDGQVYANVTFDVTVNTATSEFTFALDGARRIDNLYELNHGSIAKLWNEALLNSIRTDLARPTVHARNLFHVSVAMYDAWAAYSTQSQPYLLGSANCPFRQFSVLSDVEAKRKEAISFAAYRLIRHRFARSPGVVASRRMLDDLMLLQGYDIGNESRDYSSGSGAALGNYIADCVIAYGLQDGANEANAYAALNYKAVNAPLPVSGHGNPNMTDPDRWQPLAFETFIDQSGNVFPGATPPHVTPEWGRVKPFALQAQDLDVFQRDGADWWVYHDPGPQSRLADAGQADDFKWSHSLVAIWASHHDAQDGVMWDISPGRIGNIASYPTTVAGHRDFYDLMGGGETSRGRALNPATGQPYVPQIVPRGDYTRVLAQFWADGPSSETPPGHWFTIFNHVSEHPQLGKKYRGQGRVLSDLEWDVKGYLTLGGAMHDVAVTVWGIKGWYDSSRPVSVLRYMAEKGQSTNPDGPRYHPEGFDLVPGYIEQIQAGDPLAGANGENIGEIKLYTWRGPQLAVSPDTDLAGVGWILARDWWPFQTQTFVTPPFSGYISGHSTFSRAAAEVMTRFTGSEYFPGGMSEFVAKKNEFLVAEEGPSMDVILQWATYQDASDQTSLSRIWGGIHPTLDDIPGRHIGSDVGVDAFNLADAYFRGVGR
jgi:hypothetical protein